MTRDEAREQLKYVKTLLEESNRYTNLAPASAWCVGALGLIAGAYSHWLLQGTMAYWEFIDELTAVWTSCLILSIVVAVAFSYLRARKYTQRLWVYPVRMGLKQFGVVALAGGILTWGCAHYHFYFLVPAVWLLTYGAGVYVASAYSLPEFRYLGLLFLAGGVTALFEPFWNFILLSICFGLGHVAFGFLIQLRYSEKKVQRKEASHES